jgi:hypothetical protein
VTEEEPQPEQHHGPYVTWGQIAQLAGILAVVLGVIGIVLSVQSVSLLTGAGRVWTGAALAIGGAVISLAVPRVRGWIKVVTVVLAIVCVASALYDEHQLNEKRQEIERIFTP